MTESARPPIFGPHFTLRCALKTRRLKATTIAERMGVSPQYVSALLHGRKTINPKTLNDLCDAMTIGEPERTGINLEAARFSGWRI